MGVILQPGDYKEEQLDSSHYARPLVASRFNDEPVHVSDVPSLLLEERILFIPPVIQAQVTKEVIALLLYFESKDATKDIHMYINCYGDLSGLFYYGLGIYDTMRAIKADVATYCVGVAQGAAAALLAGGAPGKRFCLPHAQVVLHQPYTAAKGQASDIDIRAREVVRQRQLFYDILAKHTSKDSDIIRKDSDRKHYMTASEVVEYGLADEIIYPDSK